MMNKKANDEIRREEGVTLEVKFEGSENVPIVFANNLFIRHEEDIFIITFAQAHGPYIVNPTPEQLKQIGKIPSQVVARIAVSPVKMKEFLDVMSDIYERFMKMKTGKV